MEKIYHETFDDGNGGWQGCKSNGSDGFLRLENTGGAIVARSPWWIDYNHAPPGIGYLNLLFVLHTRHPATFAQQFHDAGGHNRFVAGNFPVDFTNAEITVRIKGELDAKGADLVFLAQGNVGSHCVGHLLTGQPLKVTPEWTEQTIRLTPDPHQWQAIGVRHDRGETYAWGEVEDVLKNLDVDFMFLLHPIDVVPDPPLNGNPHLLKAGEDYPVDRSRLPEGYVMLDDVRIRFASND